MRLEDITPGQFLEGIAPDAPARILAVLPIAADALGVLYRDASGSLGERLVGRQHEPLIHVPARHRPWAFDADGHAFQQAAIECLDVARNPSRGLPAASARILQRGAFLLDPSRDGLAPELLLLVTHTTRQPGATATSRRVLRLAVDPLGRTFSAPTSPWPQLQSIDPTHWPLLHEALRPLLANHRIRDQALAFVASQLLSNNPPAEPSPSHLVTPPVLLGAAIVVPADLIRWLRNPEDSGPSTRKGGT